MVGNQITVRSLSFLCLFPHQSAKLNVFDKARSAGDAKPLGIRCYSQGLLQRMTARTVKPNVVQGFGLSEAKRVTGFRQYGYF